jgi:hypothetical protein
MTIELAKEIAMALNGFASGDIDRALITLMLENERLSEKLGESLPNGGFCAKGCKKSMKPTIKNDTV